MFPSNVDTLIVGAGLIGSSVAMHLALKGVPGVWLADLDFEGGHSSSELNAGGIRATWTQPLNILASKLSIEYFASVAREVGYRPCGYLWMHTAEKLPTALKARELQQSLGWPVDAWDYSELKRRVPFLDKQGEIAGAVFAPRDGLINPNLLKLHFRDRAKEAGARFQDRAWFVSAEFDTGAKLWKSQWWIFDRPLSPEQRLQLMVVPAAGMPEGARLATVTSLRLINCAGPWAGAVAHRMGYSSPAKAVRRQISIFDCRDVDLTPYGMMIAPNGVYFHPEATNGLSGFAVPGEPEGYNFEYDGESYFHDFLWPSLYELSSGFERLKHLTGWAGLYEVSPDESAILGSVATHPSGTQGLFEAHSFSGHGVMHSYVAGLALSEWILDGKFHTLDLSALSARRFVDGSGSGSLLHEGLVI